MNLTPYCRTLVHENEYLKQLVSRLQSELKRCQKQHNSASDGQEASTQESHLPDELPPWTYDPNVMTPLLFAYDARIKEYEAVISRNMNNVEKLRNHVHELAQVMFCFATD